MQKITIDRFEGTYAICEREDKTFFSLERSILPINAKEGSIVIIYPDNTTMLDEEATKQREKNISALMESLFD